jgi:hypothetical protein
VQKAVSGFKAAGTEPISPDEFELAQQINVARTFAGNGERRE